MKLLTRHEEHVLLTILRLEDNAYLVTVRDYLEKHTSKELSFGTLYVSLRRLEKTGFIKHYIGEATAKRGGKAIKYYRLTLHGVNALKEIQKVHNTLWLDFADFAYKIQV